MTTMRWVQLSIAAHQLNRRSESSMLIRYEDFIARPRDTVLRILALVGEPEATLPFLDENTVRLSGNHTVAGNTGRFASGETTLKPDDEWMRSQSARDRLLTTALTLPFLRRYDYPLRVRTGEARERT